MTLPNPRVDYQVDPTGTDERLAAVRTTQVPGGLELSQAYGLVTLSHAICASANRHALRRGERLFSEARPQRQEPRHG